MGLWNYPYRSSPLLPQTVNIILVIGQEKLHIEVQLTRARSTNMIRLPKSGGVRRFTILAQISGQWRKLTETHSNPLALTDPSSFHVPGSWMWFFFQAVDRDHAHVPLRICPWPHPQPSSPLTISPFIGSVEISITLCLEPPFSHVPHI